MGEDALGLLFDLLEFVGVGAGVEAAGADAVVEDVAHFAGVGIHRDDE